MSRLYKNLVIVPILMDIYRGLYYIENLNT